MLRLFIHYFSAMGIKLDYRVITKNILQYVIIILLTLFLLEFTLFAFLKYYNLNSILPYFKSVSRSYYMSKDRNIIQFMPECAKYDDELTYTLKEGDCIIKNREFEVKYDINSLGLRDDEKSLDKPEIIVLGDSHAMGWGVAQDKTFAFLTENNSNKNVLNAAISSYGTARESLILDRIDKSKLKYLIIQYCQNDYGENKSFVNNDFKLNITSEAEYQKTVNKHINRKYKPFRFSSMLIRNISRTMRGKNKVVDQAVDRSGEFNVLIEILSNISNKIGNDVKIIIFETNGHNNNDSKLFDYIETIKKENKLGILQDQIMTLDTSEILTGTDYFILDDHMNQNGHQKVANELLKLIQ